MRHRLVSGSWRRLALALTGAAMLAACEVPPGDAPASPAARPVRAHPQTTPPSEASVSLARYYARLQSDLMTRGQLRTDGGGPDTPFSAEELARNFETLVFYNEYPGSGGSTFRLNRWTEPVRIGTEFGPSVPAERQTRDRAEIARYAGRLARLTGHPVDTTARDANFHVFVAGEDDKDFVQTRLDRLVPGLSRADHDLFRTLPRQFYCLVLTVPAPGGTTYSSAVVLIRAEHPDLVRLSCIHEEIAQGLGVPNDSPRARPSIFNDDDEFALLTSHDELLLKMLYDPRLKPGMTADEARPLVARIAQELTGQAQ